MPRAAASPSPTGVAFWLSRRRIEARGWRTVTLGAAALADMIYRYDASRLQFPLRSISDFWYLLRKPLERYLQRLDTLPWGATIPGATLSFIDAWIEAQNCITHYLGYIRRLENVYQTVLEPYVSALPGFEL